MSATRPLTTHEPDAVLAWGRDGPVTTAQFHEDVERCAAELPPGRHVINACADRYRFMVGLGACLLDGRTSLMPSNLATSTVAQMQARYPGLLCLHDGHERAEGVAGHELGALPARPGARAPADAAPRIPAGQVAAIVFTSGSTGEPTPHGKRWGGLCANGASEALRLRAAGLTIVATVPAQHMYGFESSILLALHGGARLWRDRPFYPADIAAALAAVPRPRMLVTTPFHLAAVLESGVAMPACDTVLCATAPLSEELARAAERLFAAPLIEIYGCTESGQVASRRTVQGPVWQLLPGVRMEAAPDGAWVFDGHVEGRVRLSDHIEDIAGDRFRLGARHADMVNVAGKRASLAALSAHLKAIEGVVDGCFVPPADESSHGVARLAALVVAPGLGTRQILAALRERIDPAFLPRPLVRVERLPRNATGKLVAAELQDAVQRARRGSPPA